MASVTHTVYYFVLPLSMANEILSSQTKHCRNFRNFPSDYISFTISFFAKLPKHSFLSISSLLFLETRLSIPIMICSTPDKVRKNRARAKFGRNFPTFPAGGDFLRTITSHHSPVRCCSVFPRCLPTLLKQHSGGHPEAVFFPQRCEMRHFRGFIPGRAYGRSPALWISVNGCELCE